MSRKHELLLNFPVSYNDKVFRIEDISIYSGDLATQCGKLQIMSPGFNTPVEIDVDIDFSLVLTACDLEQQTESCDTENVALNDGLYVIKYSVAPNDLVYVQYNILRTVDAMNTYFGLLGDIEQSACELNETTMNHLKELRKIKYYLDAAKIKVEWCNEPVKGLEMFKYGVNKLENFSCKNLCN